MHSIRQRTAAQRSADENEGEVLIQDEQEQDEEIALLRKQNEATDALARRLMDIFILVMMFLTVIIAVQSFQSSRYLSALLTLGHTVNLARGLSPNTLPQVEQLRPSYNRARAIGLIINLCKILCVCFVDKQTARIWGEAATLSSPLLIMFSRSLQENREGRSAVERSLEELERAKYRMKGA